MKVLNIETDERAFYEKYLIVMDSLFNIRPNARKVFAELMYFNNKYESYSDKERGSMLFVRRVKEQIMDRYNMTQATIDNQLTYLRDRGFIKGLNISSQYLFSHKTHAETMFSFKIK